MGGNHNRPNLNRPEVPHPRRAKGASQYQPIGLGKVSCFESARLVYLCFNVCVRTCVLMNVPCLSEGAAAFRLLKRPQKPGGFSRGSSRDLPWATAASFHADTSAQTAASHSPKPPPRSINGSERLSFALIESTEVHGVYEE